MNFSAVSSRPVPVAPRDAVAADVQFAGHADRDRPALLDPGRRTGCSRSAARSSPAPAPARPDDVADQTVVSVGPYMFQTDEERASSASARSRGSASPPQRTLRLRRPVPTGLDEQPPGRRRRLHHRRPGCRQQGQQLVAVARRPRASPMTTRPPTQSGRNSSSTAMSNARVVTASSVSWAASPGSRAIEQSRLTTARCVISHALGLSRRSRREDQVSQVRGRSSRRPARDRSRGPSRPHARSRQTTGAATGPSRDAMSSCVRSNEGWASSITAAMRSGGNRGRAAHRPPRP